MKTGVAVISACAIVYGFAGYAAAQGQPTGGLSDKSVATLMEYAWQILPTKFTAPSGKVIEVDKKNKRDQATIPVETAREVIRVAYNSAQAQVCEMWEEQATNFETLMRRENAKKKWTDQQMLYITTLHRMTIHTVAGKIRVVEKEGELKVFLEPIEPGKDTCPTDKKKKVAEAIESYVKIDGGGQQTTGSVPAKAATQQATTQPSPVSAPAKDQKKK